MRGKTSGRLHRSSPQAVRKQSSLFLNEDESNRIRNAWGKTRSSFTTLLLLLLMAGGSPAAEVLMRCRWVSPNDRRSLDISFAKNALLAMLPGETLVLTCESAGTAGRVVVLKDGQPIREETSVSFTAPQTPGAYYIQLSLTAAGGQRNAELCVFVPYKGIGRKGEKGFDLRADDQEIGHYRHSSRSGNVKVKENPESYLPPVWWFRMTDLNADFEVVPGVPVGDLVAASEDTGVKHTDMVPVHYPMWLAIRTLRQALETRGIPGHALKLISVFRSPPYNRSIGSNAFGRHVYGDAFDFYIDIENDGKASDLNGDGKRTRHDAYVVVAMIEDLQAEGRIPMGGIGVYNTIGGDHEVTMHLDMRGHRATWGYLYTAGGRKSEFSWASRRFADLDRRDEDRAAARAAKEGRKYHRPKREPLPLP